MLDALRFIHPWIIKSSCIGHHCIRKKRTDLFFLDCGGCTPLWPLPMSGIGQKAKPNLQTPKEKKQVVLNKQSGFINQT
jgi:hypothetical protein